MNLKSPAKKTVGKRRHYSPFNARMFSLETFVTYSLLFFHVLIPLFQNVIQAHGGLAYPFAYPFSKFSGHTVDTYHDIQSLGVEKLWNIYASAGLSIKPKTKTNKIELIKEYIRATGVNLEEGLTREALSQPARTIITPQDREEFQLRALSQALKEALRRELFAEKHSEHSSYSGPER